MHEYSIVQALVDRVTQEASARGATKVVRLCVGIGELAGVEIDLLITAYETFRERTLCEQAPLDVEPIRAEWQCPRCQRAFEPGAPLRCDPCGVPARMVRGDEIVLKRIELEVPDV